MSFVFKKARRSESKLRIGISGPSGSGKTYSALVIATSIAAATGDKIAVIDTEHNSAALYADHFEFDTLNLAAPYTPERFIEAIQAAEAAGYGIVIADSITHEWKGVGGILEIVDQLARSTGNSYAAWAKADPRHRKFIDAMLTSKAHIIATMRSKTAYIEAEGRNGKKTYQKAGMAPEQRDGMEYEFTLVFDLADAGRSAIATKDRTGLFRDPTAITAETGEALLQWLRTATPEEAEAHQAADKVQPATLTQDQIDILAIHIENCNRQPELQKAWDEAKKACQKAGDMSAYATLKAVMEKCAAAMKAGQPEPTDGASVGDAPGERPTQPRAASQKPTLVRRRAAAGDDE